MTGGGALGAETTWPMRRGRGIQIIQICDLPVITVDPLTVLTALLRDRLADAGGEFHDSLNAGNEVIP